MPLALQWADAGVIGVGAWLGEGGTLLVLAMAGTAQMRHGMLPSFIGDGLSMLAFAATALRANRWRRGDP